MDTWIWILLAVIVIVAIATVAMIVRRRTRRGDILLSAGPGTNNRPDKGGGR